MPTEAAALNDSWNAGQCVRCGLQLEPTDLECEACGTRNVGFWCSVYNATLENNLGPLDHVVRLRNPGFYYFWLTTNSIVALAAFLPFWFAVRDLDHSVLRDWALNEAADWFAICGVVQIAAVVLFFRLNDLWWWFCRKHGYS